MYAPGPKKPAKKLPVLQRGVTVKTALARAQIARDLQAYQFGAYDTQESTRAFVANQARANRWARSGRAALVQNADGNRGDDDEMLGIAPLVIGAVATAAGGGRVAGVSFKKPSARVFGGPLVSTVNDLQARIERGDLSAVQVMDGARKNSPAKVAWARIWTTMLPSWNYPPSVYELIKRLDPSFSGGPGKLMAAPPPGVVSTQPPVGPMLYPPPATYLPAPPAPAGGGGGGGLETLYKPTPEAAANTPPGEQVPGETPSGAPPAFDLKKLIVPGLIAATLLL